MKMAEIDETTTNFNVRGYFRNKETINNEIATVAITAKNATLPGCIKKYNPTIPKPTPTE